MKTLSDIAASYDEWAKANEATAEEILTSIDSFAEEIRGYKRWRANWLTAEASELRERATDLRRLERQRSIREVAGTAAYAASAQN